MDNQDTTTAGIEEIKEKLRSLGAPEEELDAVIEDVTNIITSKALTFYIENLPDESVKNTLKAMEGLEIVAYIEAHSKELPPLSEKMLSDVATSTWDDYFRAME